ncbi:MAG: CrcB family protein [Propionibacterium sp.]|nr:CrcB family protein [Propionibacterium sp.]
MAVTRWETTRLPPGLWVFGGGCLGTLARAALSAAIPDPGVGVPTTTLAINLSGALILGWLLRTLALTGSDRGTRRVLRLGVGTGVLGGYTTFSTFDVQSITLALHHHVAVAAIYLVVSLIGGFAAAWAGTALAHRTVGSGR